MVNQSLCFDSLLRRFAIFFPSLIFWADIYVIDFFATQADPASLLLVSFKRHRSSLCILFRDGTAGARS
jgi:hypothetical protein